MHETTININAAISNNGIKIFRIKYFCNNTPTQKGYKNNAKGCLRNVSVVVRNGFRL